jgi:hypothetical protein
LLVNAVFYSWKYRFKINELVQVLNEESEVNTKGRCPVDHSSRSGLERYGSKGTETKKN